ncbi:MAG: hypothetical protein IPM52_07795 [Bacteroidetes bacterium]|nr:hypothetical protein [Bacteroidota bacterium]
MHLLISLLLLAACQRKQADKPPVAFEEAEAEASRLLGQLGALSHDDIAQLEVRAGRLLLDQGVQENQVASETLHTALDFLSTVGEETDSLQAQVNESLGKIRQLKQAWLDKKDERPLTMERFFMEKERLDRLMMQADYLVNRWNVQLLNIENFEQAFPQHMND